MWDSSSSSSNSSSDQSTLDRSMVTRFSEMVIWAFPGASVGASSASSASSSSHSHSSSAHSSAEKVYHKKTEGHRSSQTMQT